MRSTILPAITTARFMTAVTRCTWLCVLVALSAVLTSTTELAAADKIKFPYEARVVADNTFARAGAGDTWFPTQRLAVGTIVTIHRHDAGGWFMISPPEGSFSWIPERYVQFKGNTEAELIEDNVVAYVGSDFGDETTVWQRSLSKGTRVTVLERRRLFTLSGEQAMVRILPPVREYRWIPGSAIVPIDENVRRQLDNNPYQTPSNAARPAPEIAGQNSSTRSGTMDVPQLPADSQLARLRNIRDAQQKLAQIDQRFRTMISGAPDKWNLDEIESDYQQLQQSINYKPVAGQIDLRYPAIERYRRKLAELNEFQQLTSQTEQRDAQLVAQIMQRPTGIKVPPAATTVSPRLSLQSAAEPVVVQEFTPPGLDAFTDFASHQNAVAAAGAIPMNSSQLVDGLQVTPPADFTMDQAWVGPDAAGNQPMDMHGGIFPFGPDGQFHVAEPPASLNLVHDDISLAAAFSNTEITVAADSQIPTAPSLNLTSGANSQTVPASYAGDPLTGPRIQSPGASTNTQVQYIGAGLIQRNPAGRLETPFVLTTPAGRVLAHLKPDASVDLEPFLGQAVGLHGSRWFEDKFDSDVIEVSGLEPVRIR